MTIQREQYDEGICTIPPEGWWCSRAPGHEGPCAAAPWNWHPVGEVLPKVGEEVLLHWPVPDRPSIFRVGKLLYKPFPGDNPIWKLELDYGDAGAWVYVNRGDEQPTHWAALTAPEQSQ